MLDQLDAGDVLLVKRDLLNILAAIAERELALLRWPIRGPTPLHRTAACCSPCSAA